MPLSESWKARGGLLVVFGLGNGLLSLHVAHAIGEGETFWTFLFGILIPMGFAVGILIGGMWLWQAELEGSHNLRIGVWCLVGCGVLAIGAVLTILYEQAEGVTMSDQLFVVVNAASGGGVVGFIVGVYDVRQRIARSRAERMSQQLTVLNRVLRHDIRNGANVIWGQAAVLPDSNESQDRVETIQQQAMDLVELGDHARAIEQLLHENDEKQESMDIVPLLDEQLERIEQDYPTVDVRASLPAEEPVYAHPLVGSAIANVLDNAVKHNDKQTPRIRVDCSRVTRAGSEYAEIRIVDNGPGIPEGEIEVLERGYETPLDHTTGLGLWLVNWIVTESGGDVRFEENAPEGSTVCLQFEPVQAERPTEPEPIRH